MNDSYIAGIGVFRQIFTKNLVNNLHLVRNLKLTLSIHQTASLSCLKVNTHTHTHTHISFSVLPLSIAINKHVSIVCLNLSNPIGEM